MGKAPCLSEVQCYRCGTMMLYWKCEASFAEQCCYTYFWFSALELLCG
ncbi:hypothetical protein APHCR_1403 [Anaplasma phagocytophilum str. CR1007]|uniref:Uncharacterized protein n=2 Tax=Anaplasma phagocytophilum TaxID=948 RepID=A0A0F3NHQ8_ANAPH|nr:hypothetical protein APHMUC_0053 [Anaplasma phagocytophilum str. ApMUC09]KJV67321.1 hypothetical protein APHNP_1607 [Anaplasma phagocytophilum str. ApNP]KKA00785.1 hypothetical protein APHCR_1403 [Anaplasma phagocytophilum str. CR1007]